MISKEAELSAREKRVKSLQKEIEKRERELNIRDAQIQAARANQAGLERRVRELKEENTVLKARVTVLESGQEGGNPSMNSEHEKERRTSQNHQNPVDSQPESCCSAKQVPHCQQAPNPPQIIIAPQIGCGYGVAPAGAGLGHTGYMPYPVMPPYVPPGMNPPMLNPLIPPHHMYPHPPPFQSQ